MKMIADMDAQLALRNWYTFGHKRQKISKKKGGGDGSTHEENKDDFDGTLTTIKDRNLKE